MPSMCGSLLFNHQKIGLDTREKNQFLILTLRFLIRTVKGFRYLNAFVDVVQDD